MCHGFLLWLEIRNFYTSKSGILPFSMKRRNMEIQWFLPFSTAITSWWCHLVHNHGPFRGSLKCIMCGLKELQNNKYFISIGTPMWTLCLSKSRNILLDLCSKKILHNLLFLARYLHNSSNASKIQNHTITVWNHPVNEFQDVVLDD